jgi:3',5'-cyclic AMP phosphodiesterase CpdA
VALDSVLPGERKGVFCADRLAWLDATLSRAPDTPTLLFMHHPPFDILPDYEVGYRNAQDRVNLAAVVGLHKQVLRLLCGQRHQPAPRVWAGTIATLMPSVAVDLRKGMHSGVGADQLSVASDF